MALCDYRTCDVCGGKAFYDSHLNYTDYTDKGAEDTPAYKVAGEDQGMYGVKLDHLGDWAVLCTECAKTHKCSIVPIEAP